MQKRFGNPLNVAEAFRNQLNNWPNIDDGDRNALRRFADFLDQISIVMDSLPALAILNDGYENRTLALKLPRPLTTQWVRKVARSREESRYPSCEDFANFVSGEAQVLCDPLPQPLNAKRKRNIPQTRVVRRAATKK